MLSKKKVILLFALNWIIILVLTLVRSNFYQDLSDIRVEKEFRKIFSNPFNFILVVFFITTFVPFFEELLFRYPLKYNKNGNNIFIGILIFISIFFASLTASKIILVVYLLLLIWQHYYKKDFGYLSVVPVLAFAFLHTSLYDVMEVEKFDLAKQFLLFSPQFFTGCFLAFIRIKTNFKTVVFYHSAFNAIVMFIAGITYYTPQ